MTTSTERTYDSDEINQRLQQTLPQWRFADGHIEREYRTQNWKSTLMAVNTIGHLAEAAWHHPELGVSYNRVHVKLQNHSAKGITDKDFELAAKLDAVVLWRPGAESGALTGPPDDPRFAHMRHDDK